MCACVSAVCICTRLYPLYVCMFRQRPVRVIQIDLDITEVVHIQGHWIIFPFRTQRLPSIYQARQLFNMKSNKMLLKCQSEDAVDHCLFAQLIFTTAVLPSLSNSESGQL